MPLTINYQTIKENKFDYPFRVFVSGSSQSGKTFFTRELIANSHIFSQKIKEVKYYHPDYLSVRPINWHDSLSLPVCYQSGLPSLDDLCKLMEHTCVVIDDLYEECINSKQIDYLFRVLSGKRSISVVVMSQRYFAQGRFGMNIRNNCNFTVLMRNADARVNAKVAALINQKVAVSRAIEDTYSNNYYPYIFIDSSPRGQVSGYQIYTNIFDRYQITYNTEGMKAYVVAEKDFLQYFSIVDTQSAKLKDGEYENEKILRKRETPKSETNSPSNKWKRVHAKLHQRHTEFKERRKYRANL